MSENEPLLPPTFAEQLQEIQRKLTPKKKPKPETTPVIESENKNNLPVSVVADQFSDMRMAAAFAQMFHGEVRYWPEVGKWLVFDGQRWTTDAPGGAFPYIRRMIEKLYERAVACTDYAQRGDMLKAILKLEAHPRQETILAAARTRPELIVSVADLDRHAMLLSTLDGTINLESGQIQLHQAGDFITRMTPIEFNPAAMCPLWLEFLNRILDGNQDVVDYVQRFVGYCLTGRTSEQILLFLYGLGCNGKSVFANVLGAILGDFASASDASLLMARDNRTASNDVAGLRGARLVKVSEFDDGERLAEAQIKTLTGGDPVSCRFLYGEFFSYIPSFKILLIGNHKPKIRGTDYGIWRRLHLIHFHVTIPEQERDLQLQNKLMAELPGILAWAVRGCLEWQRIGLNPPAEITAAVSDYRQSEDIFNQWIIECCVTGDHMATPASDLLTSFIEYSKWRGTTPQKLGRMLAEAGFIREPSNGKTKWRGLGLISNTDNRHWQDKDNDLDRPF